MSANELVILTGVGFSKLLDSHFQVNLMRCCIQTQVLMNRVTSKKNHFNTKILSPSLKN